MPIKKKTDQEILEDKLSNPTPEVIIGTIKGQFDGYQQATKDILELIFNSSEYSKLLAMLEKLKY